MFDIITFGSATKDIFLRSKENIVLDDEKFSTGKGVCFSLGSKIKIDEVYLTTGGGGTNTAVTFSKQGFNVAYCGKIGRDEAGEGVLKDLENHNVNIDLISSTDEKPTNHSVIIDVPGIDRTILIYRGASDFHCVKDILFEDLKAKWFYLAPFSDSSEELFYDLLDYAVKNNISVMANPSKTQLKDEKIKDALKNVDILLLNQEETSILTGIPYEKENEAIKEATNFSKDVLLVTQGVDGVVAYSKNTFYRGKPIFPDADDRTGAGDSFGSGFLSEYIRSGDVEKSLQLGIANSTACLQKPGAKHGLLKKNEEYPINPLLKGEDIFLLSF
jgi:sugar/nucleoside kinase (ribokinase family)